MMLVTALFYRGTSQIMLMIMVMRINRHCRGDSFRTEQFQIGRVAGNSVGLALTTDMMVET